jgi:shikimate kinase
MKIFLIGMPGSGKSTLGRQLAEALTMPFIDLDYEIEKMEGSSIKEIFSNRGEEHFRRAESAALKLWASSQSNFVLATGGGAPCFHDGINIINAVGLSIFLDVPVKELVKRVEQNKERPLLAVSEDPESRNKQLEEKLNHIRNTRLPVYRQASIVLENPSLDQVLHSIKN